MPKDAPPWPGPSPGARQLAGSGPGRSGWIAWALAGLLVLPGAAASQSTNVDQGPPVVMETLYEATFLRIDVLTLTVQIGGDTAERMRGLARRADMNRGVVDSIARLAADATDAHASLRFERDVSLDRFLDEVRGSTRAAREAGFIDPETFEMVDRSLPGWYAFLEGRGVEEGDEMQYRIAGDTLEIRYRSGAGELLLDQRDMGAERRRAVLGGYFAPDSDFREGLVDSLLQREGGRSP